MRRHFVTLTLLNCLILLTRIVSHECVAAGPTKPLKADIRVCTDCYGDPLPQGAIARLGTLRHARTLVSASRDKTVRLWDLATGQEVVQGHSLAVRSVRFSPDGKVVPTGSPDHTIRIWEQ